MLARESVLSEVMEEGLIGPFGSLRRSSSGASGAFRELDSGDSSGRRIFRRKWGGVIVFQWSLSLVIPPSREINDIFFDLRNTGSWYNS